MNPRAVLVTLLFCVFAVNTSTASPARANDAPSQDIYQVLLGGARVGELRIEQRGDGISLQYAVSNNGRGSSSNETIRFNDAGLPMEWKITGATTFGNAVNEHFAVDKGIASWRAAAGEGKQVSDGKAIYVAQNASPYAKYLYAKAILNNQGEAVPALPAGMLRLKRLQSLQLTGVDGLVNAHLYALSGIEMDPDYVVLDDDKTFIATVSPRYALIKNGYEANEQQLRNLAASMNAKRFEQIAQNVTHSFDKPVRVTNVRLFEPQKLGLSPLKSVVVEKTRIVAIEDNHVRKKGEVIIDGEGGTLVPGLYEMHGHMSDNHALLNVLAGVTSVRDMGNEINVLDPLIDKIEQKRLIGPRITKSGFIEGSSPFSNATGEMAASEEEAVALVKDYARHGDYFQIKIYSSVKGEWVPAMAKEAKKHGLRVAGHIPAFARVDEMIASGYDEITHINQVMLSWVLEREEDTRTLYRITGMKRFVELDLNDPKVERTLNLMAENHIAVDPTIVIHEFGLTARNGSVRAGMGDYIEHMPIGVQRKAKVALLNVADEAEDKAYKQAFDKILQTLALMHKRGIFIVPGTDLGGAFELHRELELFTRIGMTPAEALRRGSYDMAHYLGYGDELGSIEVGKLADFFLVPGDPTKDIKAIKTISLVSKGGDFYFPGEVYPEFGIKPFVQKPEVLMP